jgi:hypothetical protein
MVTPGIPVSRLLQALRTVLREKVDLPLWGFLRWTTFSLHSKFSVKHESRYANKTVLNNIRKKKFLIFLYHLNNQSWPDMLPKTKISNIFSIMFYDFFKFLEIPWNIWRRSWNFSGQENRAQNGHSPWTILHITASSFLRCRCVVLLLFCFLILYRAWLWHDRNLLFYNALLQFVSLRCKPIAHHKHITILHVWLYIYYSKLYQYFNIYIASFYLSMYILVCMDTQLVVWHLNLDFFVTWLDFFVLWLF